MTREPSNPATRALRWSLAAALVAGCRAPEARHLETRPPTLSLSPRQEAADIRTSLSATTAPPAAAPESEQQAPPRPDGVQPLFAPDAARHDARATTSPADPLAAWRTAGAVLSPDDGSPIVTIDAGETIVGDAALLALVDQPQLRHLNLRQTLVTDAGLSALQHLPDLEFLGLSRTAVTDLGIPHLGVLHKLRYLTLAETPVTDAAIPYLVRLQTLRGLNLKGARLTRAGIEELRAALPQCQLVVDESASDPGRHVNRPPELIVPDGLPGDAATSAAPRVTPEERLAGLLEEHLQDPKLLETLGELYLEQGRTAEALSIFRQAAALAPTDPDLRFQLGIAEAESRNWEAARENLTSAVGPAAAEYNLAVIMRRHGQVDDCRVALERSLQWDPDFSPARALSARLDHDALRRGRRGQPSTSEPVDLVMRALLPPGVPRRSWEVAIEPAVSRAEGESPIASAARIDEAVPVIRPLSGPSQ